VSFLDRWLPAGGWRLPTHGRPDPAHLMALVVVLLTTLLVFLAFLAGNLFEARVLTPGFVHSYATQVGLSSLTHLRLELAGFDAPVPPQVEFTSLGYSIVALWYLVDGLFSPSSFVDTTLLLRQITIGIDLAGAPLLFLAARRTGLGAWAAAFVAIAYLLNPFQNARMSYDICGYQGTMLIGAYLSLQGRHYGRAWLLWFLAAGGHPFSLWAITLWAGLEWRSAARAGLPSRTLKWATGWFTFQSALALFTLFVAPLFWHTLFGSMESEVAGDRALMTRIPSYALGIVGLLAAYAFLPVARSRWLLLVIADALYYIATGLDHGLMPSTVGLLGIAALEGAQALVHGGAVGESRPVFGRIRRLWAASPVLVRRALPVLVLAGLLGANLSLDRRNLLARQVASPVWDGDWMPEAHVLAGAMPDDLPLCVVHRPLFPILETRCRVVVPLHDPLIAQLPPAPEQVLALHTGLFDAKRYPTRFREKNEVFLAELCAALTRGEIEVIAASGEALLLSIKAGETSRRSPALERFCARIVLPE
jgi:hypothetical protein